MASPKFDKMGTDPTQLPKANEDLDRNRAEQKAASTIADQGEALKQYHAERRRLDKAAK